MRAENDMVSPLVGPVLLGVIPGQPAVVAARAAEIAERFNVPLVCIYVDVTQYAAQGDGAPLSFPVDPDGDDDVDATVIARLTEQLNSELQHHRVQWSLETKSGEPAHVLTTVARELGASMIVVGTRAPGLGRRLEEWLRGSVAVHLSRRQDRPVIVVPLHASVPAAGHEGLDD